MGIKINLIAHTPNPEELVSKAGKLCYSKVGVEEIAKKYDLDVLAKIPINPEIAKKVDMGKIEDIEADWLEDAVRMIDHKLVK